MPSTAIQRGRSRAAATTKSGPRDIQYNETPPQPPPTQEITNPPSKKRKPNEIDSLPDDWIHEAENAEADIDDDRVEITSNKSLQEISTLALFYFVDKGDNQMLDTMKVAATYIATVCEKSLIEVVCPDTYDQYKDTWDGSLPYDKHPLIGPTFPRLEKYIWIDMAAYFKKEVIKHKNKMKKHLSVDAKIKESWGKMCRFLRHFRKLHLYLLLVCPDLTREEIHKLVLQSFKKCKTEGQIKTTTISVTKKFHRTNFPEWYEPENVRQRRAEKKGGSLSDDDEDEMLEKTKKDETEKGGNSLLEQQEGDKPKQQENEPGQADNKEDEMLEKTKNDETEKGGNSLLEQQEGDEPKQQGNEPEQHGQKGGKPEQAGKLNGGIDERELIDMDTSQAQLTGEVYWPGRRRYIKRDNQLVDGPPKLAANAEDCLFSQPSKKWQAKQVRMLTKLSFLVDSLCVSPHADSVHFAFHMNRSSYVRAIIVETNHFDDDGELRPFALTNHLLKNGSKAPQMVINYALALTLVLGGTFSGQMRFIFSFLRRLVASELIHPLKFHEADEQSVCRILSVCGLTEDSPRQQVYEAIRDFTHEFVENRLCEMPRDVASLTGMPAITEASAKILLSECFGIPFGVQVNESITKFAIATGLVHYEDGFFYDDGGQDMFDIDLDAVDDDLVKESLETWLSPTMYHIINTKVPALGLLLNTSHREYRDEVYSVLEDNFPRSSLFLRLDHFVDLLDFHRGEDWSKPVYDEPCIEDGRLQLHFHVEDMMETWYETWLGERGWLNDELKQVPFFGRPGAQVATLPCLADEPASAKDICLKGNNSFIGRDILAPPELYLTSNAKALFRAYVNFSLLAGKITAAPSKKNKNTWTIEWSKAFPTVDDLPKEMVLSQVNDTKTARALLRSAVAFWFQQKEEEESNDN